MLREEIAKRSLLFCCFSFVLCAFLSSALQWLEQIWLCHKRGTSPIQFVNQFTHNSHVQIKTWFSYYMNGCS